MAQSVNVIHSPRGVLDSPVVRVSIDGGPEFVARHVEASSIPTLVTREGIRVVITCDVENVSYLYERKAAE